MTDSPISRVLSQSWPASRGNDYRQAVKEAQEAELRRVICGHCGKESRLLTGPEGRAWFTDHKARKCDPRRGVLIQFPKGAK